MHRFIVYQYGKVGSTSVVNSLNKLPGTRAFQSHFLGEPAFSQTLARLQNPDVSDYFFEHSAGQLFKNLRIWRHYQRRNQTDDALTMVTLAREPFDWFRSSIAQDIQEHLRTFRRMLEVNGEAFGSDGEAVTKGCALLFERLIAAIEHCGSVDQLTPRRRTELKPVVKTADQQDFEAFLFLLNTFMRPHVWFRLHFGRVLETDMREMSPVSENLFREQRDWGNIYLLRYEGLAEAFPAMLSDLGISEKVRLSSENRSGSKPFSAELAAAFASPAAQQLKSLCRSDDTTFLGY